MPSTLNKGQMLVRIFEFPIGSGSSFRVAFSHRFVSGWLNCFWYCWLFITPFFMRAHLWIMHRMFAACASVRAGAGHLGPCAIGSQCVCWNCKCYDEWQPLPKHAILCAHVWMSEFNLGWWLPFVGIFWAGFMACNCQETLKEGAELKEPIYRTRQVMTLSSYAKSCCRRHHVLTPGHGVLFTRGT